LAFVSSDKSFPIVLTSAGSHCIGFHLKTTNPTIKIGHREDQNGGIGTGKALNSAQVVCLDVAHEVGDGDYRVATGWVDGAVRVFAIASNELNKEGGLGLVQTLLHDEELDDEFMSREPLVLNGHSGSPIRSIIFDPKNSARLASGSSDGAVVLWDVIEECGLFRLLGHRGAITDIHFASLENGSLDLLITSSLDGLVKVWDLKGQCCVQTIASHRGKVWAAALMVESPLPRPEVDGLDSGDSIGSQRARLITGDDDGQAKVWSVHAPPRHRVLNHSSNNSPNQIAIVEDSGDEASTDCCEYMGSLRIPATMSAPDEHVSNIRFDSSGRYVGVLHANAKSIYIYAFRSPQESYRRKQRRLSRKRQKEKKAQEEETKQTVSKSKKRGILDDVADNSENTGTEVTSSEMLREKGEAGDEFEFLGTATASHKIRNFVFVPWKEKGSIIRLVCSLTTNALEVVCLHRSKNRYVVHVIEMFFKVHNF
jgi:U3 small nucleolar RNA-associated protein 12